MLVVVHYAMADLSDPSRLCYDMPGSYSFDYRDPKSHSLFGVSDPEQKNHSLPSLQPVVEMIYNNLESRGQSKLLLFFKN